jgi:hypothetical protein
MTVEDDRWKFTPAKIGQGSRVQSSKVKLQGTGFLETEQVRVGATRKPLLF